MGAVQPSAPKLFQQAQAYQKAGRLYDAELVCRQVLALTPRHHDSLNLLGEIAGQCGRNDDALALIGEAVKLKPSEPRYHHNLATVLIAVGRPGDAVAHLRKAVRKKPDFVAAHSNLAAALYQLGQWEQAEASARAALRLDRNCAHAHMNLGIALRMLGKADAAIAAFREAYRLDPRITGLLTNLSTMLMDAGFYAESEEICREAVRVDPNDIEARYALGYLLLLLGRMHEGWQGFEARRQIKRLNPLHFPHPLWDGRVLDKERVLLHAEEGLGDTLQFCRFAPFLADRARIIFAVPDALVRLLSGLPGVERVITMDGPVPEFELHFPLLCAARLLGTTLDTIPAAVPYLHVNPDMAAYWRGRLRTLTGLRVGLAWSGNPNHANDRRRSIPLDQLAQLADVPGVSFVSLQKGEAASQARAAPKGMVLHDWTDELGDFADTAALVDGLDLVIGVDTSVVHLAGALGKPVWLLNRFDTDWRWLLDREDSPWYPTLRQFRQPRPGDWDTVVQAVSVTLAQLAVDGRCDDGPVEAHYPPGKIQAESKTAPAAAPPISLDNLLQNAMADHTGGQLERAEQAYRRAIALEPAHSDSRHLLGVLLYQTRRIDEAIMMIEQAIELQPFAAHYHNNLGNILRDIGRTEEGLSCFEKALSVQPNLPDLHHNRGKTLNELGRDAEAELALREAIRLRPDFFDAYNDLGNVLTRLDRAGEALDLFKAALLIKPGNPIIYNNMGLALIRLERHRDAAESFQAALQRQPDYGKAHFNLAKVMILLGQWKSATERFREAVRLMPDDAETHVCYGMMLLLTGQLEQGWPEMDWAREIPEENAAALSVQFPARTWNGEHIGQNTLVLYADQGLGDTIQLCRYISLCKPRANIIFLVPPALHELLSQIEGVTVYSDQPNLPNSYVHCPIGGLPGIFKTSLATIPNAVPYLRADAAKVAAWRGRLSSLPGLRVGLVWAGNPKYTNDSRRSIAFEQFSVLADIQGLTFVSLQKGIAMSEARAAVPIHDWMDDVRNLADTAALVEALDLVISVDTSVVHLAGALGKPVWLLNRFDTDWRWLLNRDDSPWYPTLRQFRQSKAGDWESVLLRVKSALLQITAVRSDEHDAPSNDADIQRGSPT